MISVKSPITFNESFSLPAEVRLSVKFLPAPNPAKMCEKRVQNIAVGLIPIPCDIFSIFSHSAV